jgi:selenium metabolism protein YedF
MTYTIDARGLACPQPVINSRKALEQYDSIITIVDNITAVENIRRMAGSINCTVTEDSRPDGIYLTLTKTGASAAASPGAVTCGGTASTRILAISKDVMGTGDDALGAILIKSFFHTLAETPPMPDVILLFNSGVRLAVEGSGVIDDLMKLQESGVRILSCGTCLDFYKLKDRLKAGIITNMYEIKELLLSSSAVVNL